MTERWHSRRLISIIKDIQESRSENKICFIIGAGASRSSGIRTGAELAREWFAQLKHQFSEEELAVWKKEKKITDDVAIHYTDIYEKRFSSQPTLGYDFLNREMNGKEPSFGYSVFAQLLTETAHNVVITTNFDNLIEVSLYTFTGVQPLICGHESLARFARVSLTRPLIAKVHRDLLLEPKNNTEETRSLAREWNLPLRDVCKERTVVAIGYGGNDGSLMTFLDAMDKPRNLLWCVLKGEAPSKRVEELLQKQDGKLVEIDGFDELMFDIQAALGLTLLDSKMEEAAKKRAAAYREQIKKIQEKALQSDIPERKEAAQELSQKTEETWWAYELRAQAAKSDDDKENIYKEGLAKFSESHELMGYYAIFLTNIRKNYDEAEKYYKKALELDPNHAINTLNYAIFLKNIRKNYDEAEKYYKKSYDLNPNHAGINGSYAVFLNDIRRNYDEAEKYYKKALELAPNHTYNTSNYAGFLLARGRKKEATPFLFEAFKKCDNDMVLLELWFYRYAHYPEYRYEAPYKIEELITKGIRSPGWNFDDNIIQAEKENHSDIAKLKELAATITAIN